MNDTSPEFEALLRARYAALSGAERMRIGAGMFDAARVLVLASFPADLPPSEVRRRLCERFYGKLAGEVFQADRE